MVAAVGESATVLCASDHFFLLLLDLSVKPENPNIFEFRNEMALFP